MSGSGSGGPGFLDRLRNYASPLDIGLGLAAVVLVALLPAMQGGFRSTLLNVVLYVQIYMILALGLNVVVGFTGLLDLGYVVFLATGAFLTAFLLQMVRTPDGGIDWAIGTTDAIEGTQVLGFDGAYLLILLASGLACALLGVIRGIPTLRVTGDYFAIVTLGIAEIMYETCLWDETDPVNLTSVTGGAFGSKLAMHQRPTLFGAILRWDTPHFYYLVLILLILTFLAVHHVNRSRVGRAFGAIRLDETAARSCGVNVARYKLVAFAVSGFLGGIGGSLYAIHYDVVAVKALDVWQSILILCAVVLGGMGSIRGAAIGTAVLMSLGEVLREDIGGLAVPPESRFLVYGLLLIVFMRFRPEGILPPVRRGRPLSEGERSGLLAGAARLFTLRRDPPPPPEPAPESAP